MTSVHKVILNLNSPKCGGFYSMAKIHHKANEMFLVKIEYLSSILNYIAPKKVLEASKKCIYGGNPKKICIQKVRIVKINPGYQLVFFVFVFCVYNTKLCTM